MLPRLSYGTVCHTQRRAIYVVRVHDDVLDRREIDDLTERMSERLASRGELMPDIVVVQGDSRETYQLLGEPHAVSRVREALFNAAVSWSPLDLG
jgi:hypothetical protein